MNVLIEDIMRRCRLSYECYRTGHHEKGVGYPMNVIVLDIIRRVLVIQWMLLYKASWEGCRLSNECYHTGHQEKGGGYSKNVQNIAMLHARFSIVFLFHRNHHRNSTSSFFICRMVLLIWKMHIFMFISICSSECSVSSFLWGNCSYGLWTGEWTLYKDL